MGLGRRVGCTGSIPAGVLEQRVGMIEVEFPVE